MALQLSGRQVFIASPSGLDSERELLRETVERYNRTSVFRRSVAFVARGWEDRVGGVGRPQSLINEILDECDFTVVVLADRWGSAPGSSQYTSGTEEEFMRSLELLGDPQANMRDVLVLFKSVPDAQVADPGEEFSKVLAFKRRLQASKQILFETFDSDLALQERFEGALASWDGVWGPRIAKTVELPSDTASNPKADEADPVTRALALVDSEQLVQAESVFAMAVRSDDPRAMSEFARFLRRQGRLSDSHELNLRVVDSLAPQVSRSDVETGFLADALANLGVIDRKRGNHASSLRHLKEAIKVARSASAPLDRELAYALDNLGHTLSLLDRPSEAATAFGKAAALRSEDPQVEGRTNSLLNEGWANVRARNFRGARAAFERAEGLARPASHSDLLAKALTGRGSCLLSLGDPASAIDCLQESLELNRAANSSDGVGIAAGLLARGFLAVGDARSAETAAREALAANQSSTNAVGLATSKWRLAQAARLGGREPEAIALFSEAIGLAEKSGNARLADAIRRSYAGT